jgi:glutathione S-transferase
MYKLYYYPGNANLAPHMLLEEIGAPYVLELVDRNQNAHHSPEYLRLNPSGRIPVLIDGDLVLFETAAICLHLADRHPDANLAPSFGTPERATFYKWLMYLATTLQPELLTYFYPHRLTGEEALAETVRKHAEGRISGMLDVLEAQLTQSAGPWLLGEHYTAVDPYLMMLARWTRVTSRPAKALPHLGRFLERMAGRTAVQRTFAQENLAQPWF